MTCNPLCEIDKVRQVRVRNRARDTWLQVGEPSASHEGERKWVGRWTNPRLSEEIGKSGRGRIRLPRIPLMHAEVRGEMEDPRPFAGRWKDHSSSCVVGVTNRAVRIQVDQLNCSKEFAAGYAYDVTYLAECAGAANVFNLECPVEPLLQGTIVPVAVRVTPRRREPPDYSGSASRVDDEVKADSGECDAEKDESQEITVHWVYKSPQSLMRPAPHNGSGFSGWRRCGASDRHA